jgi:glycosyltransferase involved in cell wall biosynthesis
MSPGGAADGLGPDTRVLLDCRWLGRGGAGRVTEHLLRELRDPPPPGRWTLWGSPWAVRRLTFEGAALAPTEGDPHALFGQREAMRIPRVDIAVYPHQIRPLTRGRSVTFVLDTIPLRHGGPRPVRVAKRGYFALVARQSTRILTISEHSRGAIERDLGVPRERIGLVPLPVDVERARRVADARLEQPPEDVLLYVGRFDRHKNLGRLCDAFARSAFGREGRLLLVGGRGEEPARLQEWASARGLVRVEARSAVGEAELDRLLASCRALVLPSLEEGYGLPAFEAAAAGIPVAVSRTGALSSLPPEVAVHFDPRSVDGIAAAIDVVTQRPATEPYLPHRHGLREGVLAAVDAALRD